MADKESKAEKKRLKAEAKMQKKQAKQGIVVEHIEVRRGEPAQQKWYKNPEWVRAIVAVASLAVLVITLLLTL